MFCTAREYKTSCITFFLICWKCLATPSKIIMTNCRNFDVYLQAKNELYPEFLLWNIGKILQTCYSESLLRMLDHIHQQHHLAGNFDTLSVEINLWKTLMFICMQKINFMNQFFPKVLQRNSKLVILVIWGCLATHNKTDTINLSKTLSTEKKSRSHPPYFLGDIAKIYNAFFNWYFGHAG